MAGCDRGTDSPPADPTPAEVRQTTAAGSTTAEAVIGDLRAHGFKVGQPKESEAFGAKESVDTRIDGKPTRGQRPRRASADRRGWRYLGHEPGLRWLGRDLKAESRALAAKIAEAIGGIVR